MANLDEEYAPMLAKPLLNAHQLSDPVDTMMKFNLPCFPVIEHAPDNRRNLSTSRDMWHNHGYVTYYTAPFPLFHHLQRRVFETKHGTEYVDGEYSIPLRRCDCTSVVGELQHAIGWSP